MGETGTALSKRTFMPLRRTGDFDPLPESKSDAVRSGSSKGSASKEWPMEG